MTVLCSRSDGPLKRVCLPLVALAVASGYPRRCAPEDGGGVCPEGNTCCPLLSRRNGAALPPSSPPPPPQSGSGCIPDDMPGPSGVCCGDGTGCAPGYRCAASPSVDGGGGSGFGGGGGAPPRRRPYCERNDDAAEAKDDPLVRTMPRYALCSPPEGTLELVHGLPVAAERADDDDEDDDDDDDAPPAELAYYSTHGDVLAAARPEIRAAVVAIHGAGRNADDYFCSVAAAARLQTYYEDPPSSVLVVAPRFLDPSDGIVNLTSGNEPMRWGDGGGGDRDGSWRYGADAARPPSAVGVSSFDAVDRLVCGVLGDAGRFANLERIVVAGHSSGGQFVQRWALLSGCPLWGSGDGDRVGSPRADSGVAAAEFRRERSGPTLRAVAANPSSYAYLDGRRFVQGSFRTPNPERISSCPNYNQWEWGLDPGGDKAAPYKDRAIRRSDGVRNLALRFSSRDVVYLNGGADQCNVTGLDQTGWCYSHGLETECGDRVEGQQRLERGERYYESLNEYFGRRVHTRAVVEGVGHDHSLIWESEVGLKALFSDVDGEFASNHEISAEKVYASIK